MNTKHISKEQLQEDFRQVVLYFTCETIHKFFDDEPKKMLAVLEEFKKARSRFLETGTKISKERYYTILRDLIRINFGVGIPRDLPKAMFRRGAKRCVLEYVDEMVAKGELKVLGNGILPTKKKQHFTKKYLLPLYVLEDFFEDNELAKIKLDNRIRYWTKRQNRFIGKEIERRKRLKKDIEVLAAKKKVEDEENELQEQVDEVLAEMEI